MAEQVANGKQKPFDIVHCQGVNTTGNCYSAEQGYALEASENFLKSQRLLNAVRLLLNPSNQSVFAVFRAKTDGVLLMTRGMVELAGMQILHHKNQQHSQATKWAEAFKSDGLFDGNPHNCCYAEVVCGISSSTLSTYRVYSL